MKYIIQIWCLVQDNCCGYHQYIFDVIVKFMALSTIEPQALDATTNSSVYIFSPEKAMFDVDAEPILPSIIDKYSSK